MHDSATGACAPVITHRSFILARPAQLWWALTQPDCTQAYWMGMRVDAPRWAAGEPMRYWQGDRVTDEHTLLVVEPGHRLCFAFHPVAQAAMRDEPPSRADLRLIAHGPVTELCLRHDGFAPGSVVHASCAEGWPRILSSLKTWLETGQALPWPG